MGALCSRKQSSSCFGRDVGARGTGEASLENIKIPGAVALLELCGWESMMQLPLLRGAESGRGCSEVKMATALKGLLRRTYEAGVFAHQQASPWEKFSHHVPAASQITSQSQQ